MPIFIRALQKIGMGRSWKGHLDNLFHKAVAAQTTADRCLLSLGLIHLWQVVSLLCSYCEADFLQQGADLQRETTSWGQSYLTSCSRKRWTWKSLHSCTSPSDHVLWILQISSYSLTVRATDNGHPAQSSDVAVRVHVSDVNDNPPRFFQLNYSVVVQVSRGAVPYPAALGAIWVPLGLVSLLLFLP